MTAEKEQDRNEKRKKETGFIGILKATFRELKEKILELKEKLARIGQLNKEEEGTLNDCEKEARQRKVDFAKTTYGKNTKDLKDRIKAVIDKEIEELGQASADEIAQKRKELVQKLKTERAEAQKYWQREPKDLDRKLKGICQDELEQALQEQEKRTARAILASGGEQADLNKTAPAQKQRLREERRQMLLEANPDMPEAEVEQVLDRLEADVVNRGRSPYYPEFQYFNEEQRKTLMDFGDEGDKKRREVFNDIFQHIDMASMEHYREAFSGMGLNMMNKLAEYRKILGLIEGSEGPKIINEFMAKVKQTQMLHDAVYFIEQGAGKPEDFEKMMERFTPELFDQVFKEPEAELAAHLYEAGVTQIRNSNENWMPAEAAFYDAENKESQIDRWVRDRIEKVLRAKYGDEDFKKDWNEQRIRRVMALGKGYEMVTLRMPEMVARGRIPLKYQDQGIVVSPPYEDFVRPLDAFEHLIEKFEGYNDPGTRFLLYLMTGEKLKGSSRAEIEELFRQKYDVDPHNLRLFDIVNWLGVGGPWSKTGWRRETIIEGVPEEEKKWMGLAFRLAHCDHEHKERPETDKKEAVATGAYHQEKKEIFEQALKRNPIRILREAELMDGEIFDPEVRKRVLQKFAEKRNLSLAEVDKKELEKRQETAEDSLIVLAQIEADPEKGKKGRKGEIDFNNIKDSEQREDAKAYYKAITELVNEKVDWTIKIRKTDEDGKLVKDKKGNFVYRQEVRKWKTKDENWSKGTMLDYLTEKDYPYAPGLEDTPWSDFKFAKMGQKGFARRIRDYVGGYKAMIGFVHLQESFGKLRQGEDIVKQLDEIWNAVRAYTKSGARERMEGIYEGISRLNASNWVERYLPAPFGAVARWAGNCGGLLKGVKPTSYAQEVYGPAANGWRAVDIRNFLFKAQLAGHIDKKQREDLQKKLRCTTAHMWMEGLSRGWLIGGIFVAGVFLKELKEQVEADLKNQGR